MDDACDSSDLPHVNLVFIGPSGCGKSTTAGRLIADSGAIDKENLDRIARDATEQGQEERSYAWILDKLQCERDRGGTMYVALWRLSSRRCRFTLLDAPGHNDFAKDIVTAMSQADIAVLVVPAAREDLDVGKECEGQIREHTLLAYTLGLRQLVVCVNKMDSDSVQYAEDHFERACDVVTEDLNSAGMKTHDVYFDVHFVPTSGWIGDNVISRSENTPWYGGPTLIEALDDAVASHFKPERPLRFPVREVMKIGGTGVVVVGRVATGSLKAGTKLLFVPGNVVAEVLSITMHHEKIDEAVCGDSVNVVVDVAMNDLRSGMVGAVEDDSPACECSSFLAQVIVLSPPRAGEINAGCTLWVECHTSQVECVFEELLSRADRRTGKVLEMMPQALRAGDAAVVRLRPLTPLCVEAFSEYPPLGRFSVRDQRITVAVGVVQEVEFTSNPMRGLSAKPAKVATKRGKPTKVSKVTSSAKPKTSERKAVHERRCTRTRSFDDSDVSPPSSPNLTHAPPPMPLAAVSTGSAYPAQAGRPAHLSFSSSPFTTFGGIAGDSPNFGKSPFDELGAIAGDRKKTVESRGTASGDG